MESVLCYVREQACWRPVDNPSITPNPHLLPHLGYNTLSLATLFRKPLSRVESQLSKINNFRINHIPELTTFFNLPRTFFMLLS